MQQPARITGSVIFKTYRLPLATDQRRPAIRIAQATDVPYFVRIFTVGPAGGWAALAYNAGELNIATDALPLGETLILPTFQNQEVVLAPRQVIFAKGGVADTIVSVAMSALPPEFDSNVATVEMRDHLERIRGGK